MVRAADLHGSIRRIADLDTVRIRERFVRVRIKDTSIRARVYAPIGRARQTVLLVSGLHPAGIDEPRLVALARKLAEANVVVVTPAIPELSRFEVTPSLTDRIEQAALWLAIESGLAPTGRIGLMGISFSGGLAVVAAGRPSLRNHLLYVFSFGGHDDLRRVLEYSVRDRSLTLSLKFTGSQVLRRPSGRRTIMASQSSCSPSPSISCRRSNWRSSATPCVVFYGPRI